MSWREKMKKGGIRLTITLVLLTFLIWKIDFSEIISVFRNVNLLILILSLPLFFSLHFIRAVKWNLALRSINIKISLLKSLRAVLIGTFYGMITPGRAGELARAYYINEKKSKTIPTIIWDKTIEIISLIILSLISILLFFKNIQLIYMIVIIMFILGGFIILILNKKVIKWIAKTMGVHDRYIDIYLENMMQLIRKKDVAMKMLIWSMVFYLASIAAAIFVLVALKPDANLLLVFSLPIIILFGNAPITISGLGLREGIAAFSFAVLGESAPIGFSFSFILFLIMTVIPGMVGYILTIKKKPL